MKSSQYTAVVNRFRYSIACGYIYFGFKHKECELASQIHELPPVPIQSKIHDILLLKTRQFWQPSALAC